jgi:exodeoxyribonuclease VII large subunit
MQGLLATARGRLERLAGHPLLQRPEALLEQRQQRLDELSGDALVAMRRLLERLGHRLGKAAATALALSPTGVLLRGYSICRLPDGAVLRRVAEVAPGDALRVTVSDGDVQAEVTG